MEATMAVSARMVADTVAEASMRVAAGATTAAVEADRTVVAAEVTAAVTANQPFGL